MTSTVIIFLVLVTSLAEGSVLQNGLRLNSLASHREFQNSRFSLRHKNRFPFERVLFGHVPKTGGTSMRSILQGLCGLRQQSLQVCYNTVECDSPVILTLAKEPHTKTFERKDATNQIVYGHGVTADFGARWGLKGAQVARVMMLRDPLVWVASRYEHGVRASTPGFAGVSFGNFVEGHMLETTIPEYMQYLMVDSGSADMTNVSSFMHHWQGARESANILLLRTENYEVSVMRLARFLGLSQTEVQRISVPRKNSAPTDYVVSLRRSQLIRLQTKCRPMYIAYDLAVEQERLAEHFDANQSTLGGPAVAFQNDVAHLTVRSAMFVEHED